MKIRIGMLCILLAGSLAWGQVAVAPSAGSGTSESPYEIAGLGNLYWIASNTANWDKHYIQTADIDASETSTWFSGLGWAPIGNTTTAFTGSYDGGGFSITELYINRPSDTYYGGMGLFGTATGATIKNIELLDCTVTGHWYVGILLGKANGTHIEYCGSTGNVYGLVSVGGLVGNHSSHSRMNYCYSEANVTKSLVGAEYGTRMGGLAGTNNESSKISNSYAMGSVTGYQFIGGLTGENGTYSNYQDDTARVINSYSTGYITGTEWKGGFVGINVNSESFNTNCVVLSSFWDINTSGTSASHAGTAKTTSEMKTTSTFTGAGWNFTTLWDRNDNFNDGYPFLIELMLHLPEVTTDSITNISTSTASCHSNITNIGYRNLSQHGVCWNTSENPTIDHSKTEQGAASSTGSFSSSLTSLTENTTYYVRSYSINDAGIVYGNQISFNTYAYAEIQSDSVNNISGTSAMFHGTILDLGDPEIMQFGACWNTSGDPSILDNKTEKGAASTTGSFDSFITGLMNSTTYYVRAYATNVAGTVYGNIITFDTETFAATPPPYGDGSAGDPYEIYTLENLKWLSESDSAWNKHYIQKNDIDAFQAQSWNGNTGWSPIGNSSVKFTGSYDGNGFAIDNLFINRNEINQGFFGLCSSAVIKNLGLTGIDFTADRNIGGLIASAEQTQVLRCYTQGEITATNSSFGYCGGLIFNITSTESYIAECYSNVNISGVSWVAGLIVMCNGNHVVNSYSYGNISAPNNAFGLIANNATNVRNCFWDTQTSGQSSSAGGTGKTTLEMKTESTYTDAGWNFDDIWSINESINGGYPALEPEVVHIPYARTLAAQNIKANSADIQCRVLYLGDPSPSQHGLCWNTSGYPDINDSKSQEGTIDNTDAYILSMSGLNNATTYYVRSYATNTQGTSYGDVISFTTAILDAVAPSAGDGNEETPYQIASLANLYWISVNSSVWNKHFIQTSDINASGTELLNSGAGWQPIGNTSTNFSGTYNGNGNFIDSLYINRPSSASSSYYMGLFGLASGAEIRNLDLTHLRITGYQNVGGVAGMIQNNSTIENCTSQGTINGNTYVGGISGSVTYSYISNSGNSASVSGNNNIGGITGYNNYNNSSNYSVINGSYNTGTISGSYYIGGLIGNNSNYCRANNCYNTGNVTGSTSHIGGLAGYNVSNITNSYNTGLVNGTATYTGGFLGYSSKTTSNCFWDTESSGQSTSAGAAVGKTTEEMKTLTTFTNAGWDFTDIWGMDAGINDGYPYLLWSYTPDVPLPITLTAFDAVFNSGAVLLTWRSASETENATFRIYRDEEMIAEIAGAGTTAEPQSYSWTDNFVIPGRTYRYVLADVDYQGKETKHPSVEVQVEAEGIAQDYLIGAAYPNPFNPITVVPVNLAKDATVRAQLYDISGRPLRELHNGTLAAGSHALRIDGANLSTGIYFVRIGINDQMHVQKIALMK